MQNGSLVGIYMYTLHVFFTFGTDLYAQSAPIIKISAVRSLLRVRCWLGLLLSSPYMRRFDKEMRFFFLPQIIILKKKGGSEEDSIIRGRGTS